MTTGFEDEKHIAYLDGLIDKQQAEIAALTARIDALTKEREELKLKLASRHGDDSKAIDFASRVLKAEARVKELEAREDRQTGSWNTLANCADTLRARDFGTEFGAIDERVIAMAKALDASRERCARLETALIEAKAETKAIVEAYEMSRDTEDLRKHGDIEDEGGNKTYAAYMQLRGLIEAYRAAALGTNDATPKPNDGL